MKAQSHYKKNKLQDKKKIVRIIISICTVLLIITALCLIIQYKKPVYLSADSTTLLPILTFNMKHDLSPIDVSYDLVLQRKIFSNGIYTGSITVNGTVYNITPGNDVVFFEGIRLKIVEYNSSLITVRAVSDSGNPEGRYLKLQIHKSEKSMYAVFSEEEALTSYSYCGPESDTESAEKLYIEKFMP